MKLLVFAGSTRQQSFNRQLAATATMLACAAGAEVTHLELSTLDIPMYNADLEAQATPPDVMHLKQLMFSHPAWLICSPEYNGSYTGLLKNTLDWVSSPVKGDPEWSRGAKSFEGKVVGLLLQNLQCWVAPRQFALSRAGEAFDAQGGLRDETQRQNLKGVVDQVLWASTRLQS
jgi:chromate reductase